MRAIVFLPFFVLLGLSVEAQQTSDNSLLLRRTLDKHSSLYERTRDAEGLSSVSMEGTQEQGDEQLEFLLWKKRPNLLRCRIAGLGGEVVCGYDGRKAWRRSSINGVVEIDVRSMTWIRIN